MVKDGYVNKLALCVLDFGCFVSCGSDMWVSRGKLDFEPLWGFQTQDVVADIVTMAKVAFRHFPYVLFCLYLLSGNKNTSLWTVQNG